MIILYKLECLKPNMNYDSSKVSHYDKYISYYHLVMMIIAMYINK